MTSVVPADNNNVVGLTVKEVAYFMRCSCDTVRRDFENEPGVVIRRNPPGKRVYRQIVIPAPVLDRVLRRRKNQ